MLTNQQDVPNDNVISDETNTNTNTYISINPTQIDQINPIQTNPIQTNPIQINSI
jgi:hypothetical protein